MLTCSCAVTMGRKRKEAKDWVSEYPDDLESIKKKPKGEEAKSDASFCCFCAIELTTDPSKKPWDRIKEHLSSARHSKLKGDYSQRSEEKKNRLAYMNVW